MLHLPDIFKCVWNINICNIFMNVTNYCKQFISSLKDTKIIFL